MKKITAILCAATLTACVAAPTYQSTETNEFTNANYSAVDKLVSATAVPIDVNVPMLIATVVNIDSMNQSSRLGRLISEQVATRLTQKGYNVVEMKLRNNVYMQEGTGELLLSRDVRDISKTYNAQVVVVGNYAVTSDYVFLTLKAVNAKDNRIISAINYQLPLTNSNKSLLGLEKK